MLGLGNENSSLVSTCSTLPDARFPRTESRQENRISCNAQPHNLTLLFLRRCPSHFIRDLPAHLDRIAFPPLDAIEPDRLRDPIPLMWSQTSPGLGR